MQGCPTAETGWAGTGHGFAGAGIPGLSWGRARGGRVLGKKKGLWPHRVGKGRVSAAGV